MNPTAGQLLKERNRFPANTVAALADGRVVDLHTPITPPTELAPIMADDARALPIIRHSTAHVMADAVQRLFPGTKVTIGPAIHSGFYYDFARNAGRFTD